MATDGARVYAIFANGDLAACSLDGAPVWARNLGVPKNPYGHASSLTTWQGRLFVQWDQGEAEQSLSRLYAIDGATGREMWQRTRPVSASWATPIVVEAAGQSQLLTLSVPWLIAYAPADGKELWRAGQFEGEVTSSPIYAAGLVFAIHPNLALSAFRPDGAGDVSPTHLAWSAEDNVPDIPTPASNDELLFTLSSSGVLTCYDARTGARQWDHDFATECLASPGIAGEKLYVVAKSGAVFVVAAVRKFQELGRADLGEEVLASPAFTAEGMFVRGVRRLFCLQPLRVAAGQQPRQTPVGPGT
jgi:outer membrane protein assembly factor BamB